MNSDSAFFIGKSHDICQDYCYNEDLILSENICDGLKQLSIVSLSDGCSSSKFVDIGARITVHSLIERYKNNPIGYKNFEFCVDKKNENFIFKNLSSDFCGINFKNNDLFNCTSLSVIIKKIQLDCLNWYFVNCNIIGDGVLIYKYNTGKVKIYKYDFNNKPLYVSYLMNKNIFEIWNKDSNLILDQVTCELNNSSNKLEIIDRIEIDYKNEPYILKVESIDKNSSEFPEYIENITIMSDGVNSFYDENGNNIDYIDIVKELIDYKNYTGRFTQRRLNTFEKKCKLLNWNHTDDISISSIKI